MTGVQTCALPICFPVTINKVGVKTQVLKQRPFVSIHKEPLVVMNAINKNKSKIIKVKFDNIDDDLRDFDDKLLKFNIIYFTYLICLYWYIISVFKQ